MSYVDGATASRSRAIRIMDLKLRDDLHLTRKLWHISGILTIVAIMGRLEPRQSLFYLLLVGMFVLCLDLIRLKRTDINHRLIGMFKHLLRINEINQLAGISYLFIGCILVTAIFPKPIAMLSLTLLAFGDPASSAFGVLFGKDKIWGKKSLQGSLACFVVCTIVSGIFYLTGNIMVERIVLVSILTGLIGALSELIQIRKIDDNLSFPLIAGLGLWILFVIFGGFS